MVIRITLFKLVIKEVVLSSFCKINRYDQIRRMNYMGQLKGVQNRFFVLNATSILLSKTKTTEGFSGN